MSYATPLPLRVSPKYTRMHSNRMPTERAFTVCRSLLFGGGGYLVPGGGGGVCTCLVPGGCTCLILGGCTWSGGGCGPGGCTCLVPGGCTCLVLGGVYLVGGCGPGGYLIRGGTCLVWGGCTWSGTPPPWTEFLTHASEIITLPETSFAGGKNPVLNEYVSE